MRRFQICNPLVNGILGLLLAALSVGAGEAPAEGSGASPPAEPRQERWYALELDGRRAGWTVERWWEDGERRVSEAETVLRVARGESGLDLSLAGRFVETAEGEPVSLWIRRSLGSEPVETTYRFLDGRVEAETLQAGRGRREVLPPPAGEWLTPAGAREAVRRHHRAGDDAYRLRTLDPLEGLEPVTVTRTRLGAAVAPGAAGRWREEVSSAPTTALRAAVPVPSTVELDAEGEVVWSATELLGLRATLRRTDRETALAGADGPGPEVMLATLVLPDRPIPEPRRATRAVYELSLDRGSLGSGAEAAHRLELPDLPAEGAQRVERRGDRLRVTVTVAAGGPEPPARSGEARRPPPDADRPPPPRASPHDPSFLADTPYLDHGDPEIRRLLERAFPMDGDGAGGSREGADPRDRGEVPSRLTRFVHSWVARKDLDTGFATASQVARTRSGDCTEHAVLLTALLRAAGVPSRLVTGLVYLEEFLGAEGVFGYHLWVQAWTGDRWLDLDPTLPGGFDATHVALGVSDLAGPESGRELDALLALTGKLRIRVLDVD